MRIKKAFVTILTIAAVSGSSLTVFAAPETMPDGTVFDAEYYAQAYPDVTAAVGTDRDALYNHYVTFGKAEGRNACPPSTDQTAANSENTAEPVDTVTATPVEVLVGLCGMPDFMLTDNRPAEYNFYHTNKYVRTKDDMYEYYSYDAKGNLIAINTTNHGNWSYIYDDSGRLIIKNGTGTPFATSLQLTYDENGNLIAVTSHNTVGSVEATGEYQQIIYNEQGKIIKISGTTKSTLREEERESILDFIYNEQGKLISCRNGEIGSDYIYDEQGKLVKTILNIGGGLTYDRIYSYDASGKLSNVTSTNLTIMPVGSYLYK